MATPPSEELLRTLKEALVEELNLTGRDPASIADDAPLFGDGGLGLDSLDALQIAIVVEERYQVTIPNTDEARPILASVRSLAAFIAASAPSR